MTPRFPTEIPKIEPKKMPLPTLQRPPMTEVSENPLATPWKSRTSEGVSAVPKPVLKGIETCECAQASVIAVSLGHPAVPKPVLKGIETRECQGTLPSAHATPAVPKPVLKGIET